LAAELARPDTGRTLYLLDEPTTGLHFDDLAKLLNVMQRLVDLGNTVLLIEHNLDIIKAADWVVDMGPEAGHAGGQIVTAGTPEMIVEYARTAGEKSGLPRSHTGDALAEVLERDPYEARIPYDPQAQPEEQGIEVGRSKCHGRRMAGVGIPKTAWGTMATRLIGTAGPWRQ
jgi:excinuclease ABC subunit A